MTPTEINIPLLVLLIGLASFGAGIAVANSHWIRAGWLVALAVGLAWWLRRLVFFKIEREFNRGAGYEASTRHSMRRVADLEVHDVPKVAKRWSKDE